MFTLTVTMLQRIQLDALLSVQKGNLDELFSLHEIREKIRLTRQERDTYLFAHPNGATLIREEQVNLAESLSVELESEQVRRLQRLLKEWSQFSETDLNWLLPLKRALDDDGIAVVKKKAMNSK